MTEIDFTLSDVPGPMLFAVLITRRWLAGIQAQLQELLALLSLMERAWWRCERSMSLRGALERARHQLVVVGDESERALRGWPNPHGGYHGGKPPPVVFVEERDRAVSTREAMERRLVAVRGELDLVLVHLLVLGRVHRTVDRQRLGRAKRAAREARRAISEAQAEVGRLFEAEFPVAGRVELAREGA